jgi:TonB family protein
MILRLMEFLLVASVVAAAGAMLVEAGLRHLVLPIRFAWLAALALGPALLVVRRAWPDFGAAPVSSAWVPVIELPGIAPSGVTPWGSGLNLAAAAIWLVSVVWVLAIVARTHRRLTVECAGWESARVMGRDVFVSADRGPAVAGVWDPWIVLPRWALALPEHDLRLILLHEEEHVRAKDTHLLGLALALVAIAAWNPVAWWHLGRLRAAMEVDCDRRVLRREPDRATYGASLLSVAARVVGVQACGIEGPMEPQTSLDRSPAVVPAPDEPPPPPATGLGETPVFTPYTQAPDLLNRNEVAAALEKAYPPELKTTKAGGTVNVYIFIDTRGEVGNVLINRSSGHPELDEAALQVGRAMKFSPARNKEAAIPVWVSLPITFQTK